MAVVLELEEVKINIGETHLVDGPRTVSAEHCLLNKPC